MTRNERYRAAAVIERDPTAQAKARRRFAADRDRWPECDERDAILAYAYDRVGLRSFPDSLDRWNRDYEAERAAESRAAEWFEAAAYGRPNR